MLELDRLWAPWRMAYVTEVGKAPSGGGSGSECVFCELPSRTDEESLIVERAQHAYCVLNLYPYNSGHLMVVPYRHAADVTDLSADEGADMMALTQRAVRALRGEYGPDAFNLGANLGRAAGAGIPGHFHVHVLPRWSGDTNFLTTIGGAKALPEVLPDTWRRVKDAMAALPPPKVTRQTSSDV